MGEKLRQTLDTNLLHKQLIEPNTYSTARVWTPNENSLGFTLSARVLVNPEKILQ
jgi:hypothetical protein